MCEKTIIGPNDNGTKVMLRPPLPTEYMVDVWIHGEHISVATAAYLLGLEISRIGVHLSEDSVTNTIILMGLIYIYRGRGATDDAILKTLERNSEKVHSQISSTSVEEDSSSSEETESPV